MIASMPSEEFDIALYLKNFVFQDQKPDLFSWNLSQNGTIVEYIGLEGKQYPKFVNEFWTAKQRQAAPLHEIAYRACFKPQLPRFFVEILTRPDDLVYDPFSGRGTTVIEAALLGRAVAANDINPLSTILSRPRLFIPDLTEVKSRLESIPLVDEKYQEIDLSMFYHPGTFREMLSLRAYLGARLDSGLEDDVDSWIRMVATNRLTGHSPGFFSVYTLPPNQAVSPESQTKINEKRHQKPTYRDTKSLILRKSNQLTTGLSPNRIDALKKIGKRALFLNTDARRTPSIADRSVQLTVTSPPFLDIVQYAQDNWMRCWFNTIDVEAVSRSMTMTKTIGDWSEVIGQVFDELFRITKVGGWVAFEVGEVRNGTVRLDEHVVPLGLASGFTCEGILINQQEFTKTANIWGVSNNATGTNTNRVAIFHKNVSRAYRHRD
jgi:DNA methylase